MNTPSPLARLIHTRMQQLGIGAQALGFRLGHSNAAKATGRVDSLSESRSDSGGKTFALLAKPRKPSGDLASALMRSSRRSKPLPARSRFADELRNGFSFTSTLRSRRLRSFSRWLWRYLEAAAGPRRYSRVPFFGEAFGFIINYSPDHALRCTITGEPLQILFKAYGPGEVELCIGNRPIATTTVARLLGFD